MCVEPTLVLQCVAMGNVSLETECRNKRMWFWPWRYYAMFTGPTLCWRYSFFCTNSCRSNGFIGWSRRQIAGHWVAIECSENSCFNFRGSTAIFLAYEQWNCVTGAETRGGTQMAWLHDQRCRIKEHTPGSPTSSSSCIKSFSCKQMGMVWQRRVFVQL